MDKYTLLVILNLPFVLFGLLKAYIAYKKGSLSQSSTALRVGFWLTIALGLFLARYIYEFLYSRGLTDSQPLSIADVVLVTGVVFCLFLNLRTYSKLELMERRFNTLHEKLSVKFSTTASPTKRR